MDSLEQELLQDAEDDARTVEFIKITCRKK